MKSALYSRRAVYEDVLEIFRQRIYDVRKGLRRKLGRVGKLGARQNVKQRIISVLHQRLTKPALSRSHVQNVVHHQIFHAHNDVQVIQAYVRVHHANLMPQIRQRNSQSRSNGGFSHAAFSGRNDNFSSHILPPLPIIPKLRARILKAYGASCLFWSKIGGRTKKQRRIILRRKMSKYQTFLSKFH